MPAGLDDDDARGGGAPAGKPQESVPYAGVEIGSMRRVEAQLHGSGHLVHILPSRARGAHEVKADVVEDPAQEMIDIRHGW